MIKSNLWYDCCSENLWRDESVAQHILRKDLKKDEIREKFVRGAESVASHQQLLWVVIGAAIVVALAVFGWRNLAIPNGKTAKASRGAGRRNGGFSGPYPRPRGASGARGTHVCGREKQGCGCRAQIS